MLTTGHTLYKVYAEGMHDYHKAFVALRDADNVGVIEVCLEKPDANLSVVPPDKGTGIIVHFICNLNVSQMLAIWHAAGFPCSAMRQTLAQSEDYTGDLGMDNTGDIMSYE